MIVPFYFPTSISGAGGDRSTGSLLRLPPVTPKEGSSTHCWVRMAVLAAHVVSADLGQVGIPTWPSLTSPPTQWQGGEPHHSLQRTEEVQLHVWHGWWPGHSFFLWRLYGGGWLFIGRLPSCQAASFRALRLVEARFHWGFLVAAVGVSELLSSSTPSLGHTRQRENPGHSLPCCSWGPEVLAGLYSTGGTDKKKPALSITLEVESLIVLLFELQFWWFLASV